MVEWQLQASTMDERENIYTSHKNTSFDWLHDTAPLGSLASALCNTQRRKGPCIPIHSGSRLWSRQQFGLTRQAYCIKTCWTNWNWILIAAVWFEIDARKARSRPDTRDPVLKEGSMMSHLYINAHAPIDLHRKRPFISFPVPILRYRSV